MDMLCSQSLSSYFVSCTRSSHRFTVRISSNLLPDRPILPSSKSPINLSFLEAQRPAMSFTFARPFPMSVLDDLVFVNLRSPVLQKAVNSSWARNECLSWRQIRQARIEVELATFAQHLWHIPVESGDKTQKVKVRDRKPSLQLRIEQMNVVLRVSNAGEIRYQLRCITAVASSATQDAPRYPHLRLVA
jgi:hypothetical protein